VQGADPGNAGEIRERLRKMSDEELLRYGAISVSLCAAPRQTSTSLRWMPGAFNYRKHAPSGVSGTLDWVRAV
jgi:hypothetical protein